jgi:hypothetical protein
MNAKIKCKHEFKMSPNNEQANSNEMAKIKTHAKGPGRK